MKIDERVVAGIINAVLDRLDDVSNPCADAGGGNWGVFEGMDDAVEAAAAAQ